MLTKKDFEFLAAAIGAARAHERRHRGQGLIQLEMHLFDWMEENPRFDIDRFVRRVEQRKRETLSKISL